MAIDCLNNLIGVRGIAGYEDPDSGYYINDLEGITTEQLENISDDEDHYEPRLAWDDIYNRASRKLETDIRNELSKYAKQYTYIQTTITGQLTDNETITQTADYSGWRFNFGYESKHVVLNLVEFQLYLNTAVNFDIFIYDLTTGQKLDEIRFEGTEGLGTYRLLKNYAAYKHQDIFIGYDANLVSVLKMSDYKVMFPANSGTVPKSGAIIQDNFNNSSNTGLSVTYNIECSISNMVCQSIHLFMDAFLYLLGVEFCKERIYSDRINRWTLMDKEEAESLRDSFQEEYDGLIEGALKGLKIDSDGICFECSKGVNYKTMLP